MADADHQQCIFWNSVNADVGVDILVMGADGKTRFSEWVFGGATRHVLEQSTIRLFMRH